MSVWASTGDLWYRDRQCCLNCMPPCLHTDTPSHNHTAGIVSSSSEHEEQPLLTLPPQALWLVVLLETSRRALGHRTVRFSHVNVGNPSPHGAVYTKLCKCHHHHHKPIATTTTATYTYIYHHHHCQKTLPHSASCPSVRSVSSMRPPLMQLAPVVFFHPPTGPHRTYIQATCTVWWIVDIYVLSAHACVYACVGMDVCVCVIDIKCATYNG